MPDSPKAALFDFIPCLRIMLLRWAAAVHSTFSSAREWSLVTFFGENLLSGQGDTRYGLVCESHTRDRLGGILGSLRGQTIIIPNLYKAHPGWTARMNPHKEEVKQQIEEWIERWVSSERRDKYLKSRFDELALYTYPDCSAEACTLAGKYLLWLFYWDDAFDCGHLTSDIESGAEFVKTTAEFILSIYNEERYRVDTQDLHSAIASFEEIGHITLRGGRRPAETRQLSENLSYIRSIIPAMHRRSRKDIPTVRDYLEERIPNSAVIPSHLLIESLLDLQLPDWVFSLQDVKSIIKETAMMVLIVNDLLSFAKEVRDGQIDSLVPVLMQNYVIGAQGAVDMAVDLLRQSFDRFKEAESRLEDQFKDSAYRIGVERFILAGKDWVMGGLHWSLQTPRYMAGSKELDGGRYEFSF